VQVFFQCREKRRQNFAAKGGDQSKKSETEENLLELFKHNIIILITARINNKEKWLLSSSPPFT
jgi:hypothetical protein|tara:strand:- start:101 stop:292 length:192 start_codon:yes stop_codon:yes gene_type:complete